MNCFDPECECGCHDDDDVDEGLPDDVVAMYSSIDTYFNPASIGSHKCDHAKLLSDGLERIEGIIDGLRGDPGKLYPLDERLCRIVGASRAKGRR